MSKQSKVEANRAMDRAKNTFEFYEQAELGLNAESVPDALARYWTRVLAAERGRPRQRNARRVKGRRLLQHGKESSVK